MERLFSDLSVSYRRTIGTTLSHLDKVLCRFEELASGREIHSVLYAESNGLLPEQRSALLSHIAAIRQALVEIKEVLDLEANVQDAAGFIWSQCSGLWVGLSEIDSRRLKGYGGAPPGFSEYWDPKLTELKEYLSAVLEALKKG